MTLKTTIQNVAQAALKTVASLGYTVSYRSYENTQYDPQTGLTTNDYTSVSVENVIADEFKSFEINEESILAIDKKLYIGANNISVVPTNKDVVVFPDNTTWRVIRATVDPAEALWILQVRPA